ncbi:sugar phosphate isomerase/epimerase family protein [Desulfococcaceae bacterium HSG9]|nr:sugar phosphate isomerase/epimerase family protein [Desulfococcaceae bacterium HSG9]
MEISIATDYAENSGCCEPFLRKIAQAGFTHIHWCHHWNGDFLYSRSEIDEIAKWLREYGLKLLDLHGSQGFEKNWSSLGEYERLAGVELVRNRIDMTARLGGDAVVMHATHWMVNEQKDSLGDDQLRKSLDALEPFARSRNVRIAIENLVPARTDLFLALFDQYSPDFLCFCYDSGHQNISSDNPNSLELFKDRLGAVHLHDNDGASDQHNLIFNGSIDWDQIAVLMADSAYSKCINMELRWDNSVYADETEFLDKALESGIRFAQKLYAYVKELPTQDGTK